MPIPLKIPSDYARAVINRSRRGYSTVRPVPVDAWIDKIEYGLVRVADLRSLFANPRAYQTFRQALHVPNRDWELVIATNPESRTYARRQIRIHPSMNVSPPSPRTSPVPNRRRSPARNASPARARSASPAGRARSRSPLRAAPANRYRRGELVMRTKLGKLTAAEKAEADRSVISIQPTGDECDEMDVNLPKAVCAAARKVCRQYNAMRQYVPSETDNSELRHYDIQVKYQQPPGRWSRRGARSRSGSRRD